MRPVSSSQFNISCSFDLDYLDSYDYQESVSCKAVLRQARSSPFFIDLTAGDNLPYKLFIAPVYSGHYCLIDLKDDTFSVFSTHQAPEDIVDDIQEIIEDEQTADALVYMLFSSASPIYSVFRENESFSYDEECPF